MDWIPIGESIPVLTANQERIRDMLDAGRSIWSICGIMRMRREHVEEEIYDIRRKESIMKSTPNKLTNQQRAAIYQEWKDGISQADLAKQYGVTPASICLLIKKFNKAGESIGIKPEREEEQPAVEITAREEQIPEKKPAAINQEFENAIDKMIEDAKAEKKSANAEEKSKIAEVSAPEPELEDCENGIPNTPLPAKNEALPPVVLRAVNQHLRDIDDRIEALQGRIDEIKMEIEEWQKDAEKLIAWRNEQAWK